MHKSFASFLRPSSPHLLRVIALVAFTWAGVFLTSPTGAQDTGSNHAGLVVRHGDGRVTYVYVAFPESELNGMELLARSGLDAVTIPFGGLGEGVCSIQGDGCGVDGCRRLCQTGGSESPYWRYFGQGGEGEWTAFELGASSARVVDGNVQLWSWSPDAANLDPVTLEAVQERSGYSKQPDAEGPWVATVYPAGMGPKIRSEDGQSWITYAVAAAVLIAIGGGVTVAIRRSHTGDQLDSQT